MASITNDPNGRRRIQFIDGQARRHAIRLGKMSHRQALAFKVKLEDLVGAVTSNHTPADETLRWLTDLDDTTHDKLSNVSLVAIRGSATLGGFTRQYIDGRADLKPNSITNITRARSYMLEYFREDTPMRTVTEGDAEDFNQYLIKSGRSVNTIRRAIRYMRQFFKAAQRRGLVQTNPFDIIPASVRANHDRYFFVTREMIDQILPFCPDQQWRLIILLARYGGLRCPSEVLSIKWSDVNWERLRLRVPSPKTAHHYNGDSRIIPLFPELQVELTSAFTNANDGDEYIVNRYRDSNTNLRTHFHRIIQRAGYKPWPKLFQNLRSTRETELAEIYPIQVVTKWIGNSERVASKHYLQVTDDHYDRAASPQAAHNPAQQLHESVGIDEKSGLIAKPENIQKDLKNKCFPNISTTYQTPKVRPTGIEPVTC